MSKDTIAIMAWEKHLSRKTAKRKAADKVARRTRKAQRRAR